MYNGQGDVVEIVDSNGNKVAQYAYNAWGLPLSVKDGSGNTVTSATHIANLNPFRYRGYYYDNESGFYYLNSRYYDAKTGRFINADVYASSGRGMLSTNMFAYCLNNPVNYYDSDGHFAISIAAAILIVDVVCFTAIALCTAYLIEQVVEHYYTDGSSALALPEIRDESKIIPFPSPGASSSQKLGPDVATAPAPKLGPSEQGSYYGIRLDSVNGSKQMVCVTDAMSEFQCRDWIKSTADSHIYGKNRSWGVLTYDELDAWFLAYYLSGCQLPSYGGRHGDGYMHYHTSDHKLYDYYNHFHVWFVVSNPSIDKYIHTI